MKVYEVSVCLACNFYRNTYAHHNNWCRRFTAWIAVGGRFSESGEFGSFALASADDVSMALDWGGARRVGCRGERMRLPDVERGKREVEVLPDFPRFMGVSKCHPYDSPGWISKCLHGCRNRAEAETKTSIFVPSVYEPGASCAHYEVEPHNDQGCDHPT